MDLQAQALEGLTERFAVIGDPVEHSLSPKMHNAAFAALGLPYRYEAVRVLPGGVKAALSEMTGIAFLGVNVTIPHKEEAMEFVAEADEFARRANSVNCIDLRSRKGVNTDAPGFLDTLSALGVHTPATALVLGAGGSARALIVALLYQAWTVKLWNRHADKAAKLLALGESHTIAVTQEADPSNCTLVVNATAASIQGQDLPVLWDRAPRDCIAYDLYYSKQPIPFLESAREHGLQAVDGLPLLVAQGARSFEFWLNRPAPREVMLKAVQ